MPSNVDTAVTQDFVLPYKGFIGSGNAVSFRLLFSYNYSLKKVTLIVSREWFVVGESGGETCMCENESDEENITKDLLKLIFDYGFT